jgi:hypothetical protein
MFFIKNKISNFIKNKKKYFLLNKNIESNIFSLKN